MFPLKGITVVALEQAVVVSFATRQLAALGARVIKAERLGGGDFARGYGTTVEALSSRFVWLNRSKEPLTLDPTQDGAKDDVLDRLLGRADMFVHNLAPRATERLAFGTERLKEEHLRLIVCRISGYGSTGPYRDKKAYDLLVQCEDGLVSLADTPELPLKVGIWDAESAAGFYTYTGVLTSLYRWGRAGEGVAFEVSLLEALGEWMSFTAYGGSQLPRTGASHAAIVPYGPCATDDGKVVFFGLQNERNGYGSASRCWSARSWRPIPGSAPTPNVSRTGKNSTRPSRARSASSLRRSLGLERAEIASL